MNIDLGWMEERMIIFCALRSVKTRSVRAWNSCSLLPTFQARDGSHKNAGAMFHPDKIKVDFFPL